MLRLQAPAHVREFVRVLFITPFLEDETSLRHMFDHPDWVVEKLSTCRDAVAHARDNDTAVVICEQVLPDGDWRFVLDELDRLPVPPNLIVTSRLADDELWAEVLNLGGYDVLPQPFDAEEVYRVVVLAWHDWKTRVQGPYFRTERAALR